MLNNKINAEGQMLRIERLRQGKELKEVVNGICSVSTLSKIERGKQKVDPDMLVKLYKELGINYENNEEFVDDMRYYIKQYFYETIYQFEPKSLKVLEHQDEKLNYSPLALDWMIIKAMEYEDKDVLNILDQCVEFMSQEQLGWYYLIDRYEDRDVILEKRKKAHRILQNSYSTLALMITYWNNGEYNQVNKLSKMAINFALDEGNTWALSQVYLLLGGIYSAYNMEEAMIEEYQKAMNFLKNTNWTRELEIMYYNMGATYISLGNYKKARQYLEKADKDDFLAYHKWAVLEIKEGNMEAAYKWIHEMEKYVKGYKKNSQLEDWDKYKKPYYEEITELLEVTKLQAGGNPEKSKDYIPLLESLMARFLKDGRYGFMNFHKNSLKEAYIKNRRYKDALKLEELFSRIKTKHMIKIQK
ncbi:MAG: helix-turn-helix domain-containing protein [Tissierellia bacterium]|nr:helix-turn-helix domain-containing protein [Tissierellia bacterium]